MKKYILIVGVILAIGFALFFFYRSPSLVNKLDRGYTENGATETYGVAKNEKVNTMQSGSTNFKP